VNLFSYGSLEFAEVMRAVTGRSFAHEPARLFGWRRVRFRGRPYPGIEPCARATVAGTLWRGIDAASAARLDAFEGAAYARVQLPVRAGGADRAADVYVVCEDSRPLLSDEPWDKAAFARESLARFLRALAR